MKKKPSSLIKKVAKHEDFEILTNGKVQLIFSFIYFVI